MILRKITRNKKGQFGGGDIFAFIAVIVGIFILAPIMLKVINSVLPAIGNNIASSNISGGDVANQSVTHITNTFTSFWDDIILVAFIANMLLIIILSFLADIHPAFLIFYIIVAILALIFAPTYFASVSQIYASPSLATEVGQLPKTSFVVDNFGAILLGVIILSGIILYAKFKFGGKMQ